MTNLFPTDRVLRLDGAMGTQIQRYALTEEDFRKGVFRDVRVPLKGNNECLNLTRPDIITAVHEAYIAAGADIIESNTFSANRISQKEYGLEDRAKEMAWAGAALARAAADRSGLLLVAGYQGQGQRQGILCRHDPDSGQERYQENV